MSTPAVAAMLDSLQWGRNFIVAEIINSLSLLTLSISGFNGAATLSLRKFKLVDNGKPPVGPSMGPQLYRCGNMSTPAVAAMLDSLQWGRNFIVAEIINSLSLLTLSISGFNGAATLSLRKFKLVDNGKPPVGPSMGPQLYRCGNMSTPAVAAMLDSLQWGRNFIVAEMMMTGASLRRVCSFLQWGRNFIVAEMAPWGR